MKDMRIDESVLLLYFSGNLEPAERKRVESWISESGGHERLAKDIYYIYFATDAAKTIQEVDAQKDLSKVHHKINRKRMVSMFKWVQRIAAILFIPLLLSIVYRELKEEPIQFIEIRSNPGMISSVDLPDGSRVWLNSDSYLKYPVKFNKEKREVFLNGEAYFSVFKDVKKRFIVNTTKDLCVEVLGTEFNIDAYGINDFIATTLVKGSVRLSYAKELDEESLLMKPNQRATYSKSRKSIKLTDETYVYKDISWKDGRIILRNTPLTEITWILSKRFNVDFQIEKESLKDNSFTGTFDDQSLTRILDHLKISSKINYRLEKRQEKDTGKILRDKVILY